MATNRIMGKKGLRFVSFSNGIFLVRVQFFLDVIRAVFSIIPGPRIFSGLEQIKPFLFHHYSFPVHLLAMSWIDISNPVFCGFRKWLKSNGKIIKKVKQQTTDESQC